jgi:hypothetical protein
MRKMRGILLAVVTIAALSGCTLPFISSTDAPPQPTTVGEVTQPPTNEGTSEPQPTGEEPAGDTPTPVITAPTDEPVVPTLAPELGGGGAGSARPGEVLFVREGQIWAIGQDGTGERPLTPTGLDSFIKDMAVSPSGNFLAFTLNQRELALLNLETGAFSSVDSVEAGVLGPISWALEREKEELFYQKLVIDLTTSAPSTSSIYWVDAIADPLSPTLVIEHGLETEPQVYPAFPFASSLLVQETFGGQGDLGDWYFYPIEGDSAEIVPFAPGYSIWDVSFDGQRVLMFDREQYQAGGVVPIFIAGIDAEAGAVGAIQLSPADEAISYEYAEFGPDGIAILAIGRDVSNPAAPGAEQLLYLLPSAAGPYITIPVAMPEGQKPVAFSWIDLDTAVVAGIPISEAESTDQEPPTQLWIIDLATGDAIPLTQGDSPIVLTTP